MESTHIIESDEAVIETSRDEGIDYDGYRMAPLFEHFIVVGAPAEVRSAYSGYRRSMLETQSSLLCSPVLNWLKRFDSKMTSPILPS
jgi:hypothetical protein